MKSTIIISILCIIGEGVIIKMFLSSNKSLTAFLFFGGLGLLFAAFMIMMDNWL